MLVPALFYFLKILFKFCTTATIRDIIETGIEINKNIKHGIPNPQLIPAKIPKVVSR